jgi:transglutaminase-like putative cysteine protease
MQWRMTVFRILALGVMVTAPSAFCAEKLILRDGSQVEQNGIAFERGEFTLPQGRVVPREKVQDWWLAQQAEAPRALVEKSAEQGEVIRQMLEYRRSGQALADRYPGSPGVYIVDDGRFLLTHSRQQRYRYHFVGLILSEDLLDWGRISLGFSEGRSRQRIIRARCLTADGKVLNYDPGSVQVGQSGGGSVNFDPNSRVLSATIPGVGVGSVVETIYEYEAYNPEDWRIFFPSFHFQMDMPCVRSTLEVCAPEEVDVFSWQSNWPEPQADLQAKPRQVTIDGQVYACRTWESRDIAPVVAEPNMPPRGEVTPAVYTTFMKDWEHLDRLTGKMQLERMSPTPEIRTLVGKITQGKTRPEEQVAALYHWVQKNIRYISVKSSLSSGWSGHPASETLAQGYGDCTDKSILFATMLRCLKIDAEPVVLRTNDSGLFFPKFPVLACNHCITEVRLEGQRLYLDCTTQDYRYPYLRADDHGVQAINFIRGERRAIPVPSGMAANGKTSVDRLQLRPDGSVQVHSLNHYTGYYEARLRGGWKRVPQKLQQQVMQQFLNGFAPGAKLQDFALGDPQDLEEPFFLDYTYQVPDYAVQAGKLRIFEVPDRKRIFPEVSLEKRRYPLAYTTSSAQERSAEIALPDGWKLIELPADVAMTSQHVSYSEQWSLEGRNLRVKIRFERLGNRIPLADYAEYRRALLQIAAITKQPLFFVQPGPPPTANLK